YGSFTVESRARFFEPLITLAYVAGATSGIRLGVSVLVFPLRDPIYMAKLLATLDALSRGRLIVGAGTGWLREEFDVMGLGGSRFDQRGPITDEWIAIC